jgi:carboxypeptidase C (cathepsin A)
MKIILLVLLLAVPAMAQEQPQQRGSRFQNRVTPPDQSTRTNPPGAGSGGTNYAAGEKIDETPYVTHHEITVHGKTLKYTATVAQMPILSSEGETEAHFFYVSYTLDDGTNNLAKRPLSFLFNGGPGSPTIWLHMLALGPKRSKLLDDGGMPPPPFTLIDNDDTILEHTDLVFIDAIGTGYSRAKTPELARRFNGVQGDLQSFGEFVRMYLTRNNRFVSPLYIIGESYGTFRAAGLAGNLIEQGIAFNGIVLVSTVLNFETLRPGLNNGLGYALNLPTYAADAWFHKKLPADLQKKPLPAVLKEVEAWSMSGYLAALNHGDNLPAAERADAVTKLARYTGLDTRYVDDR